MAGPRIHAGNFRQRIQDINNITIDDFINPWNFYTVFMCDENVVNEWCVANSLLASVIKCPVDECAGVMQLRQRSDRVGTKSFRCDANHNHERAFRCFSFFEKTKLAIPDVMQFIKAYLDSNTLLQCAKFAGISYRSTAVNWGCFMREFFKEYFHVFTKHRILSGTIEIDESLFGRKRKYERGNPHLGMRIWIFGMVERESNSIILYPVEDRTEATLVSIIRRHVAPGSTIYSDGWSAYCSLNELGYQHFTVIHKHSYKKTYINSETNEEVEVHTNRIEGAWKHAKQHFKKMSGTQLSQFEGHLAEIMWRSEMKGNVYGPFFDLLRSIYTLDKAPKYMYTTPLFDSWNVQQAPADIPVAQWTIDPLATDAESGQDSSTEGNGAFSTGDIESFPTRSTGTSYTESASTSNLSSSVIQDFSSGDDVDKTIVDTSVKTPVRNPEKNPKKKINLSRRKSISTASATSSVQSVHEPKKCPKISLKRKRHRTDKVCHPVGFTEKYSEPKGKSSGGKAEKMNQYHKDAYQWEFSSSDDDFQ